MIFPSCLLSAFLLCTFFIMPKIYHSVPLDEEQQHDRREKKIWTSVFDRDTLTRTVSSWAWLAHAVLLSISLTLFTLSFCRTGASIQASQISNYELMSRISTYCKLSPRPTSPEGKPHGANATQPPCSRP